MTIKIWRKVYQGSLVTAIVNKHDSKMILLLSTFIGHYTTCTTNLSSLPCKANTWMCVRIGFQVWWHAGVASALEPSAIQGSWTPVPDRTRSSEQEPAWNTHRSHFQVSAHTFSCPTFCLTLCVSSLISLCLVTLFVCVIILSSSSYQYKMFSPYLEQIAATPNFLHPPLLTLGHVSFPFVFLSLSFKHTIDKYGLKKRKCTFSF